MISIGRIGAKPPAMQKFKPFFCYVLSDDCGVLTIVKQTGSQRPAGRLWDDDDPNRLIFIGSLALGDEKEPLAYGEDPERDMAGVFDRIAPVPVAAGHSLAEKRSEAGSIRADAGRRPAGRMSEAGLLADPAEVRRAPDRIRGRRQPITYSEIAERARATPSLGRRCGPSARCSAWSTMRPPSAASRSLPSWSSASRTGFPGQGWWVAGGAMLHGYDGLWTGPEAMKLVRKLQREAFDYWARQSQTRRVRILRSNR